VRWLKSLDKDAARVVTGRPGSGKSAVLGRLITLADPAWHDEALVADPELDPATVPPKESIHQRVYARGKTTEHVLAAIAEAAEVELHAEGLELCVAELQQALRVRARPVVVVIDALEEALAPEELARTLRPLATSGPDGGIRLLLGTWRHLVPLLGVEQTAVLDLDDPKYMEPADLIQYTSRLLLSSGDPESRTPYQEDPELADEVARAVAEKAGTSFLIAQLVAHALSAHSTAVDRSPGWQERFPTTVDDAMDKYLARFGPERTRVCDLLAPLAYAQGAGLSDEDVWADLAGELGTSRYTAQDVRALLRDSAAVDLLQRTRLDGAVAYRLFHDALAEYLRRRTLVDLADRDVHQHYTTILRDHVPLPTAATGDNSRDWLHADLYTRIHLATHAAASGQLDHLLTDPGFLARR